jgi:hypothetical protein
VLGENEWAPFTSQEEWDLAWWLMNNVGQNSIDEYLKLPIVKSVHSYENVKLTADYRQGNKVASHFTTCIPS